MVRYKPPEDAQWIVVLGPPHIVQSDRQIDYSPLEYWLRALFEDQQAAKFIFEIVNPPGSAVIVELPSPEELHVPQGVYGEHFLRLGLKRRPWFNHATGSAVILPYNFENAGHPEDTRKLIPMISGTCEDEWLKFDLTIPYPPPQPFDLSRLPQKAKMFCRRPPDVTPPPPDPMEIDRYPTPPPQQRQRTQPSPRAPQSGTDEPLFSPEVDSTPRIEIKKLDPHQEEESTLSSLRGSSSTVDTSRSGTKPEPRLYSVEGSVPRNVNANYSEASRDRSTTVSDEPDNPLSVKREFANQDDVGSQRRFELLNAVNRSHSPPESDSLAVKRELENQDGAGAQEMFEVLDAINRGQSTPGDDDSSSSKTKRDIEDAENDNPSSSSSHQTGSRSRTPRHPAPNRDRDREHDHGRDRRGSDSSSSSVRDRDERGGGRERDRQWRDEERDREPGARKRSFEYRDGRGYEDRGSNGRGEYPDKRSRANYH